MDFVPIYLILVHDAGNTLLLQDNPAPCKTTKHTGIKSIMDWNNYRHLPAIREI